MARPFLPILSSLFTFKIISLHPIFATAAHTPPHQLGFSFFQGFFKSKSNPFLRYPSHAPFIRFFRAFRRKGTSLTLVFSSFTPYYVDCMIFAWIYQILLIFSDFLYKAWKTWFSWLFSHVCCMDEGLPGIGSSWGVNQGLRGVLVGE